MSSKTKIVVLHMKEIIYTAIFLALAIVFALLLVFMFLPKVKETSGELRTYQPGTYTSEMTVGNTSLEVEVTVDKDSITSIRFSNMNETIDAMYPLVQPAMEDISSQIIDTQSLNDLSYQEDNSYTSQAIVNAIDQALKKSQTEK